MSPPGCSVRTGGSVWQSVSTADPSAGGPGPNPCQRVLRGTTMIGDLFDSPWKILIVAVVLIVLFGSKKLPHAARSLGQSMRILKRDVHGLHEDETESDGPAHAQASSGTANGFPSAELTAAPQPDQQQS